ncbi:MAG: hypothetical protein HY862_07305 [Chloroflexi bacterium]|nr:hypothetical protein [Chloroflexota bacterium]
MSRRVWLIVAFLIAFIASPFPTTNAQSAPVWEITLFNGNNLTVATLTPQGITNQFTLTSPRILQGAVYNATLSPDHTKLAFIGSYMRDDGVTYQNSVFVADLVTQTCCLELIDPLNSVMDGATLGPFSPDSTQIAVALFSTQDVNGTADIPALFSTFNVTTGIVTANKSVDDLYPDYVTQMTVPVESAVFGAWRADGVRVAATCLNCYIGVIEGLYQVWDPATGTLSDPIEPFSMIFRRHELKATGESIAAVYDESYPASGAVYPEGVPPNVVFYYSDPNQAEGQLLFQHPDALPLNMAEWVADGQAVLVNFYNFGVQEGFEMPMPTSLAGAELLFRDGTNLVAPMTDQEGFMTGTPDGWLTRNYQTNEVIYYQLANGTVTPTSLGILDDGGLCCFDVVGLNPELGTGVTSGFTVPQ